MDPILELLGKAAELTAEEQTQLIELLGELTGEKLADLADEDLAKIAEALPGAFDAARDADSPALSLLTEIAEVSERIVGEDTARQEASEQAQELIDELANRVHGTPVEDPETGEDLEGEDDQEPVNETETETEVEVETEELEPVLASGRTGNPKRTPLGKLGNKIPAKPATSGADQLRTITAASNLPGVNVGQSMDLTKLAEVAADQASRLRNAQGPQRVNLARFHADYPEDRQLSSSDSRSNETRIRRVHDSAIAGREAGATDARFEALVAAGGFCAPLPVRYDQDVVGSTDRPVAGTFAGFDGSRGGVRYMEDPTLADIGIGSAGDTDAAISIWGATEDQAADPTDQGTFKSIQRVDCGDEKTAQLYAVVAQLEVGNLTALTWPERVQAFITLSSVQYARAAEQALLGRVQALSTAVTGFGPILGTARDLVAEFAAGAYAIRVRNRVARTYPVRVIAPEAARTSILIDIARQLPGDNAVGRGEAILNSMLAEHNVVVTWTPDLNVPGAVNGQIPPVPTDISYSLALEGTFTFLDGVNLDLGFESNTAIRDSALNSVNDYRLFMEGFEQVAKFGGIQALWVTTQICPSGATGGAVDLSCEGS